MEAKKEGPEENPATNDEKKISYPKSTLFILGTEFCERYCFFSIRTILSLYLVDQLLYTETDATVIYHIFSMFSYFFPLLGSILADSWLGDFRTILYFCLLYALGSVVTALSAVGPLNLPSKAFALCGLLFIAVGSGCIKPSVMSFGGDQFVLPQQLVQLGEFYSFFYVAITGANLITAAVTPVLREYVHCFGEEHCFPLAFGTPSVVMLIALVTFLAGKRFYRLRKQEGNNNLLIRVFKCIWTALATRIRAKERKAHWLDYAEDKHGKSLVDDVKLVLRVLVMFLPIPVYWALCEQTGTTALFMARKMDGNIGFYTILPDQIGFVDSILYLALIPIFQYFIYPTCGLLKTALRKIVAGGVLMALSFVIYGCFALLLETTYPVLPAAGEAQIRIYNTLPCDIRLASETLNLTNEISIPQGSYYKNVELQTAGNLTTSYTINSPCKNTSGSFDIFEGATIGYFFREQPVFFVDDIEKNSKGYPLVRTLVNLNDFYDAPLQITYSNSGGTVQLQANSSDLEAYAIKPDTYTLQIGNSSQEYKFALGGVYAVLAIASTATAFDVSVVEVTAPNNIHMLWLVPQGLVMTMGYAMFSIPGLEFAYAEAPASMKTIIMAGWLLTLAAGNLVVVVIQAIVNFEKASYNFFLYSVLMLVDTLILMVMAAKYKYVNVQVKTKKEEN